MSRSTLLSSLNLFTLILVLALATAVFVFFMRKRSNRHPLKGREERNIAADLDAGQDAPDHSPRR